jgi:SPP1 family predicted phage head-tail adaptor
MTETRTSFIGGCYTTSWSSASIEWANCQMVAGTNESYEQNKKQQYTKWNVIMRYISTVTNKNRLSYGSKTLVIETVSDNVNRGRMMKLVCREEVV